MIRTNYLPKTVKQGNQIIYNILVRMSEASRKGNKIEWKKLDKKLAILQRNQLKLKQNETP